MHHIFATKNLKSIVIVMIFQKIILEMLKIYLLSKINRNLIRRRRRILI